jgi:hypothetical protein
LNRAVGRAYIRETVPSKSKDGKKEYAAMRICSTFRCQTGRHLEVGKSHPLYRPNPFGSKRDGYVLRPYYIQ